MQYFCLYKTVCIPLIFSRGGTCNIVYIYLYLARKINAQRGKYNMIQEEFYRERLQENLNKFIETKDIKYYNNIKEINKVCCGINRCTNNTLYDFYNLYLVTKGI